MADLLLGKGWLDALVCAELNRHDPAAALARLPTDVRTAGASATDLAPAANLLVARSLRQRRLDSPPTSHEAFLEEVRLHVALLLDLAALRGEPFEPQRRRIEIAAFFAAALGNEERALEAIAAARPDDRAVLRAMRAIEQALALRFHPPGDPVHGLPLHPGLVAIVRRRLGRVAMGFHRDGRLLASAVARHREYAERETMLLAEALSGLLRTIHAPDTRASATRQRQLLRLGLPRGALRAVRRAVAAPRPPEELAEAAPERVRPFLFEQLAVAVLRARLPGDGPKRFVEAFAASARLDPATTAAAQVEASAQHADHGVWFEAFDDRGAVDWLALADEWEATADDLVERVSSAVTGNFDAVVTELRETGELGQLLAKAAAGTTLTREEKRRVRAQLVDVAKAVPALAIFAAPGGLLLLPLLAKLLPFSLLPSAWEKKPGAVAATTDAPPPPRGTPKA